MNNQDRHAKYTAALALKIKKFVKSNPTSKLCFKHGSTNSTRSNSDKYEYVDVSMLENILEVNTKECWVLVEPNVAMDRLVDETLKYNLLPEVVMEFPGITVGGGIQGAGLESSSFKFGQFNDTCIEYELITGQGEVIKASENENQDIFYGISGTYGTLAVITLAKLRLIPAKKYIQLTYIPFPRSDTAIDALKKEALKRNDFLEGIIFSPDNAVVIKGIFSSTSNEMRTFSKAKDPWFYSHVKEITKDAKEHIEYVPVVDYLFRYNRGAFWMGEYIFPLFHIPRVRIMRFLMNPVLKTRKLYEYLHVANVTQNYFIQDYYYSFGTSKDYLQLNQNNFQIYPVWLCPIKATITAQKISPHYRINNEILLNIGIYGQSKSFLQKGYWNSNRQIEQFAMGKNARKMFYAHSYYPEEEFWGIYDYSWYKDLRKKYKADSIFPEIWEKIYVSGRYKPSLYKKLLIYVLKDIWRKIAHTK